MLAELDGSCLYKIYMAIDQHNNNIVHILDTYVFYSKEVVIKLIHAKPVLQLVKNPESFSLLLLTSRMEPGNFEVAAQ